MSKSKAQILDREIRMERDIVLGREINAARVAAFDGVQRDQMYDNHTDDQEREEIMQREEACQCRVADTVVTAQPDHDLVADERGSTEQIGDHRRSPERHLSPRQQVAHEGGRHQQQQQTLSGPPH